MPKAVKAKKVVAKAKNVKKGKQKGCHFWAPLFAIVSGWEPN